MNQEWTYRPPVLVGERIVWLGGETAPGPGEPCNYNPHHGTISWIGRVSEIGNDWIVGVEFVSINAFRDHCLCCQPLP